MQPVHWNGADFEPLLWSSHEKSRSTKRATLQALPYWVPVRRPLKALSLALGPGGAGVRVDDGYHGYRGDRDWRRDRDFRRSRNEVIVVPPGQDRRRDWDFGRSRYYEDRY